MRKGWTQEQLAEKMGVSRVTVVRWERGERWPDTTTLHTLCYLLGAQEEELTALTVGRFSLAEIQSALTEDDIWVQLRQTADMGFSPSDYPLAELRYLSLMAHAWSLAMQSDAKRIVLAGVAVVYADHLYMERRFGECRQFAARAMELSPMNIGGIITIQRVQRFDWRQPMPAIGASRDLRARFLCCGNACPTLPTPVLPAGS